MMTDKPHNICRQTRKQPPPSFLDWTDRPINVAACRNYAGDFAEELTAEVTGARRLATDCRFDLCPDLEWDKTTFIESKSVGVSGQSIVYKWRMEKDLEAALTGDHRLYYMIWHHKANVNRVKYLNDLRTLMAVNINFGILLPLADLYEEVSKRPIKTLNAKHAKDTHGKLMGYGTNGYGDGWSVPLSCLKARCAVSYTAPRTIVYGNHVDPVQVYTTPGNLFLLRSVLGITS
jgi:hypothetical protein